VGQAAFEAPGHGIGSHVPAELQVKPFGQREFSLLHDEGRQTPPVQVAPSPHSLSSGRPSLSTLPSQLSSL
jgi:hypothetical protein